jgi:hypothetical protein
LPLVMITPSCPTEGRPRGSDSAPRGAGGEVRGRQRMTTDSWRVRVFVRCAGLWVLGPDHARHAPSKRGEGGLLD